MTFCFGAACYPEQWSEERRADDARLMAEAGFNVMRLAEFAWSKMEPRDVLVLSRGETKG